MTKAKDLIAALDLSPHPEGGWFRETWRADAPAGARASGTSIYYLLEEGDSSHWHRVDSGEIWHWYDGGPLILGLSPDGRAHEEKILGPDVMAGQRPQLLVPPGWWQSARPTGAYTLVGCTVSPAFEFAHFEMAAPGWRPGDAMD